MRRVAFRSSLAAGLVMLGVGLLLVRFGGLSASDALRGFDAWPVLLVAWGLEEVQLARGRALPAFVAPLLVAVVVAALWWLEWQRPDPVAGEVAGEGSRSIAVETVDGAYELAIDVGALVLAIERGGGANLDFSWSGVEPRVLSRPGRIEVSEPRSRLGVLAGCGRLASRDARWTLRLPDVPVRISVDAGACDLDAMLDGVPLRGVFVDAGASDIRISLPRVEGEVPVRVDAGASEVRLEVPPDTGVRLRSDIAAGDTRVEGLELGGGSGAGRETSGYASSPSRFDVQVTGGASRVVLVRK